MKKYECGPNLRFIIASLKPCNPLHAIRGYLHRRNLVDILEKMLNKLVTHRVPPGPEVLQPHEMNPSLGWWKILSPGLGHLHATSRLKWKAA